MKKKRLLIIPAKSFSQRIKNKNFKNFCGKPMIEYPYHTAIKSKIFNKIHISTESELIKKKLIKKKINIDFLRPKKLASRNVGLFEVYKYVYKKYKEQKLIFHEVWALLPCTPLIDYLDLLKLKSLIDKNKLNKPVISVSKYNAPIEWAFTLNKKNKMLFAKHKKKQQIPSQDLKDSYYDVGSITVFDAKNLETNNNFYKGNFYGFELPPQKNIDIDNQNDWEFAEKLLKLKNL